MAAVQNWRPVSKSDYFTEAGRRWPDDGLIWPSVETGDAHEETKKQEHAAREQSGPPFIIVKRRATATTGAETDTGAEARGRFAAFAIVRGARRASARWRVCAEGHSGKYPAGRVAPDGPASPH